MILTRSPLRVSLGGGGTDLPSFYEKFGGFVFSAAIDKYVYIAINKPFIEKYILKYSEYENVSSPAEIFHPIIRESLKLISPNATKIEISTLADIPSGTGLGSSGSFTTGLIKALSMYVNKPIHADELAQLACHLEINILNEPIGKQDQYIAAYGGFTSFEFKPDGQVIVESVDLSSKTIHELEDNLLLFYTGTARSASGVLRDQVTKSIQSDSKMYENLQHIKKLGYQARDLLVNGDTFEFGELMHEHWEHKRKRSAGITNTDIDEIYQYGVSNGAVGGKLVGAGGGGFLMFLASDSEKLRSAMKRRNLEEVRFKFDFQGTSAVISQ